LTVSAAPDEETRAAPLPSVTRAAASSNAKQEQSDESDQARVRLILGTVAFGACHALGVQNIWPLTIFFALYTIVVFVWLRLRPQITPMRRGIAIFGDVATCSIALYLGGDKTMWVYMIYHFILTGNSCRFGGPYFWLNESLTLIGFAIVCVVTPAWNSDLYTAVGFFVALVVNPIYAHIFVGRFRRMDRERERLTVQHESETLARSRFVGSISHDIRTSLGGMKGAGEILTRIATTDLQRQTLTVFETSYRTLNTLLQDLLDLSRLEASKLKLEPARFDLHALVRDVELLFLARAKDKGIELRIVVSPDVGPFFMGDAPKLERILMNVLGNALKFTQRGYVRLQIAAAAKAGVLRFEVQDTGPGIAPEVQARIFEPFTQADSSTTREHGGSGLGLSIVRHLSDLMQGRLGLTSEQGVGSTFWFELPLPEDESPDTRPLAMTGAVIVYADCPRDMLREVAKQGVTIVEEAQAATFQRLSPNIPILANIVHPSITTTPAAPAASTRLPPTLVYNESLRAPLIKSDYIIAMPMVARWWTNAVRLEAYRRGAHFVLAPAAAEDILHPPRGIRILCVDDTQSILWISEQILLSEGYEVVTAVNGKLGLEILLANPDIALAIVDYHMPEMDGMEMIGRFRATSPRAADLPIIMLTASVSHETEAAALAGGATMFILKPFLADDLLTAIESLLSGRPEAPASASVADIVPIDTIRMDRLQALQQATPAPGFLRKTIELFTQYDAPEAIKGFDTATTAAAQRSLLHALAGSSANVGAMKFSALCREKMALPDDELTASKDVWAETVRREILIVNVELAKAVIQLEGGLSSAASAHAKSL
jgi:two-component system sensor histidine kinase RpfC